MRLKPLRKGNYSLYLDIYWKGRRSYEFLNLYVSESNDPSVEQQSQSTLEIAKQILAFPANSLHSGPAPCTSYALMLQT
ncbi:MAG: Arm DNA-binding domain-containing protein [Bacteroidota bacterium]